MTTLKMKTTTFTSRFSALLREGYPFFSGWQGVALAVACALFTISSVRTRIDNAAFAGFLDTVSGPDPQVVFVTTAADCWALVEDMQRAAGKIQVPVRLLIVKDRRVAPAVYDALVAAAGDILTQTIPHSAVSPIGRFVRTPFAITFGSNGEILLVESVGGRNARDLLTASFSRNNLGSL